MTSYIFELARSSSYQGLKLLGKHIDFVSPKSVDWENTFLLDDDGPPVPSDLEPHVFVSFS